MTDPNTLESRIARIEESDYQHHRQMRRVALAQARDEAQCRAEMRDAGRGALLGDTDLYDMYGDDNG